MFNKITDALGLACNIYSLQIWLVLFPLFHGIIVCLSVYKLWCTISEWQSRGCLIGGQAVPAGDIWAYSAVHCGQALKTSRIAPGQRQHLDTSHSKLITQMLPLLCLVLRLLLPVLIQLSMLEYFTGGLAVSNYYVVVVFYVKPC